MFYKSIFPLSKRLLHYAMIHMKKSKVDESLKGGIMSDNHAKLVGTWKLVAFDTEYQESGEREPYFGSTPPVVTRLSLLKSA